MSNYFSGGFQTYHLVDSRNPSWIQSLLLEANSLVSVSSGEFRVCFLQASMTSCTLLFTNSFSYISDKAYYQICCGLLLHNIVWSGSWQSWLNNSQYLSIKKSSFFIFHSCRFLLQKWQMQLLPIEVFLDLHPLESKVYAIEFFYSIHLSYFLYHYSHSNLNLRPWYQL